MKLMPLTILTWVVMVYLVLTLFWWSFLLMKKNDEIYQNRIELIHARSNINLEEIALLTKNNRRQRKMLMGETIGLGVSLAVGLGLILQGYYLKLRVSRSQRNFLLSITHELKSPLAAVKLSLETIANRKISETKFDFIVKNARKDLQRLQRLIENLLLSAKIEDVYKLNKERSDVNDEVSKAVKLMQINAPHKLFKTRYAKPSADISADPFAMELILTNILDNALKYSPKEESVGIETRIESGYAKIRISDIGIGIPDEEKKLILSKFYRVGQEDTRTSKGTGLGLYIANVLTKKHQGKIMIEDNVPKGTVFELRFPIFN